MRYRLVTASNILTCMRLALAPLLFYAIVSLAFVPAFIIFCIAAISDVFDGFLARWWNEQTVIGTYLDPLADKVLIITSYCAFRQVPFFAQVLPWWFVVIIAGKEVLLLCGAAILGLVTHIIEVKPTWLGKLAMVVQSLLVALLLLTAIFRWQLAWSGYGVATAMALAVAAGLDYAYRAGKGVRSCIFWSF